MARIVTKGLALKIVQKLGAKRSPTLGRNAPHDLYDFEHEGVLVAQLSVRRASEKDKGHDHMPRELFLGPGQAKRLGQCPLSRAGYIEILREKGLLGEGPAAEEQSAENQQWS